MGSEGHLPELKNSLGMELIRCAHEAGARKELRLFAVVSNFVRVVIKEASRRQGVSVERPRFVDAFYRILERFPLPDKAGHPRQLNSSTQ